MAGWPKTMGAELLKGRPEGSMMPPPTVACMSSSTALLVLYPYLDPMYGWMMNAGLTHSDNTVSLTPWLTMPSGQTSLNHRR